MRGLFPVSRRVNRASLSFGLFLCRVNLTGLAPTPTPLRFHYRHNGCFLGCSMQIYPDRGVFFGENQKKCTFFRKI